MKPVDQFLGSVRDVFARNRDADWALIGVVISLALAALIGQTLFLRRWRARRQILQRMAEVTNNAGLSLGEVAYLSRIAGLAGTTPLEVVTHLAAFERATAAAFAAAIDQSADGAIKRAPPLRPAEGSDYERVRRLRKALGFSPLPGHHWLLSTRELVVGDSVALTGVKGQVTEVNEAAFAVDLPATAAGPTGAAAALAIVRPDDSRYLSHVRVLASEIVPGAGPGIRRVFFAHDEQPDRQQHREHVRVRIRASVTVKILDGGAAAKAASPRPEAGPAGTADAADSPEPQPATFTGMLVDVSAGGLSLDLPVSWLGPIREGLRMRCSFALGQGESFEALAAVVGAAGIGPGAGMQHLRLSFTGLPDAERDRLAAAVARHLRAPLAAKDGTEPT